MEVTNERISDLVRVYTGRWCKDGEGVWRFTGYEDRLGKEIRFREGESVEAAKTKVIEAFNIDPHHKKVELTYEMPEWMDVDGTVKPVPIHIVTDDDMDMFLAMRVDIHEMKLYVVEMDLNKTLDIDGFKVLTTMDECSFAEVMSREEIEKERERRAGKDAIDNIICTQLPKEHITGGSGSSAGWIGQSYTADGFATLSAAMRHYRSMAETVRERGSPITVLTVDDSSDDEHIDTSCTPLTRDLFKAFEKEATAETSRNACGSEHEKRGAASGSGSGFGKEVAVGELSTPVAASSSSNQSEGMLRLLSLPEQTFTRDAAPVIDDRDPADGDVTRAVVLDVEYEGDELFVGRVFKSRDDCRVKIAVHAINRKFCFKNDRTTPDLVIARCVYDTCPWRVYCIRLEDSEYFQIRTIYLEHTCPIEARSQFQRQATTSVISEIMRSRYAGAGRGPTPGGIRRSLREDLNVNVSYWKAWRARELAMDMAKGTAAGSYSILPTYLHMLEKANVGTVTDLQTQIDGNGEARFKYCFVALGASVRGWSFMRNVIIIDGTHLRGKYTGCLLTASAQDGNFQIFPLAFAIVDGENDKAWEWFFGCLKKFIPNDEYLTFVSDRHSSIYSGIEKVYPNATHGACVVHLQRNVAAKFKKPILAGLISKAARAYKKSTFHEYFEEIEKVSPECAEYLMGIGLNHWARSHSYGDRYNIMTSNVAESLNAVLKEARELPIVSILEYMRGTLMAWFTNRRDKASKHSKTLTPKVEEIVEANYERSTGYEVIKINNEMYEVKTTIGLSFIVNLGTRTCSCEEWNLVKIPCSHAIAAAIRCDMKIPLLAAPQYGSFFWSMAYNGNIVQVPDISTLRNVPNSIATLRVFPPITRRPPGRPKRGRYPSIGEFKIPRKKAKRSCTRCRGHGHNRTTCKNPI